MDFFDPRVIIDTDRELARRGGLYDFVKMAWPIVDPSPFVANWHLEEVCSHLEAVSRKELFRLIINQPPGTGKSNLTGVFWPVWEWITRPATKWIYISYDATLVGTRDGGQVIKLLTSDWFLARWGNLLEPGKPAASHFNTTAGGFRFATSIKGKVTGRHGDIQVCDDPIKPKDAIGGSNQTKAAIQEVSSVWANTMSTRMVDQRTGRRVIVMQRLTHDDLSGEMLATGEYTHLRLPMVYEPSWSCVTQWGGDRRTQEGELLFPERFPPNVLERMQKFELGAVGWAAQAQQRPSVQGGGIFKRDCFRFWHYVAGIPEPCKCEQCWTAERTLPGHDGGISCAALPTTGLEIQSGDLTFKNGDGTDFVSWQVWRAAGIGNYLLACINERMSYVESRAMIQRMAVLWPKALDKLVENKANGPAVENDLRNTVRGITLVEPGGGKVARANASSPLFDNLQVFVPHPSLYPWVYPYLKQLESFPKAAHDDMVDATTQVLIRLRKHGSTFSDAMKKLRGEKT